MFLMLLFLSLLTFCFIADVVVIIADVVVVDVDSMSLNG